MRFLNIESCCKLTDFGFTGVQSTYAKRMHSVRNLKGLLVLRANGLYKLTDFTLVDGFVLNELKELYFARCNVSINLGIFCRLGNFEGEHFLRFRPFGLKFLGVRISGKKNFWLDILRLEFLMLVYLELDFSRFIFLGMHFWGLGIFGSGHF